MEKELLSARLSNDWSLRAVVYAVDTRTLSVLRSVDFAPAYGLGAVRLAELAFVVPAPAAPGEPVARVTSGRVTIAWAASPGAIFYSVEAAVAPGGPAIVSVPVAAPSLDVPAVPPGRYFVRVRAVGIGGAGPRSAEIVVAVP